MGAVSAIFSLLVAAAGWYYMFYSRAATNLQGIEEQRLNRWRQRLRQTNGAVVMLLAIGVFALTNKFEPTSSPAIAACILMAVMVLLAIMMLLGLLDLRLTWRLRHRRRP